MRISFRVTSTGRETENYSDQSVPSGVIHYETFLAHVCIEVDGVERLYDRVPMLYFVSCLQDLLLEAFLTGARSKGFLWDTGEWLALELVPDGSVLLEIPVGTQPMKIAAVGFIFALRKATLELLQVIEDSGTGILGRNDLFPEGSPMNAAIRLFRAGRLEAVH